MTEKTKILFIKPGPVLPPDQLQEDEYFLISKEFQGDVIIPVWGNKFYHTEDRGNFKYHLLKTWGLPSILKQLIEIIFYLYVGLKIFYIEKRKFSIIYSYGTNKTGIGGVLLKWLTGTKLISEIPGNPSTAFILDDEKPSASGTIKNRIANVLLSLCIKQSSTTKLLYPDQLKSFPHLAIYDTTIFHALTPITHVSPSTFDDKFIFFLGFPWHLKGVDILIKAFNLIKSDIPEHRLIIAGHCENRKPYEVLTGGEGRIIFLKGLPHQEALDYIAHCSLFVLPSRTESMGKVLLEAMAFAKPVIGSRVDGIPQVIQDNYNGLLFTSESEQDLADKIKKVLLNPELAKKLGENGRIFITTELSEESYLKKFSLMINKVLESN